MTDWDAYSKAHPTWTFFMASLLWFDFGAGVMSATLFIVTVLRWITPSTISSRINDIVGVVIGFFLIGAVFLWFGYHLQEGKRSP